MSHDMMHHPHHNFIKGGHNPDSYYQPSPPESSSSRVSSRSRVTRLESSSGGEEVAVITFARGSLVATFKVEGMTISSFEQMLFMWDAHQNGGAAGQR